MRSVEIAERTVKGMACAADPARPAARERRSMLPAGAILGDMESKRFAIEVDRETDGRWIAEVIALPGALAYGATREEAVVRVEALALRVLADRLEHGEPVPELDALFVAA